MWGGVSYPGQILEQPADEKEKEDERRRNEDAPVYTPPTLVIRNERLGNGRYEFEPGHFLGTIYLTLRFLFGSSGTRRPCSTKTRMYR